MLIAENTTQEELRRTNAPGTPRWRTRFRVEPSKGLARVLGTLSAGRAHWQLTWVGAEVGYLTKQHHSLQSAANISAICTPVSGRTDDRLFWTSLGCVCEKLLM